MAFQPDPAYLAKYQKVFGSPWAGVRRDIISYPNEGDQSAGTVNPTGNQYQGGPPIIKLPAPAPVPMPVTPGPTPVDTIQPGGPPGTAVLPRRWPPGRGWHRGWTTHGEPPAHGGRGERQGGYGYDRRHRRRHSFGPRPIPVPLPVTPGPVPVPTPAPIPAVAPTGKICPTWGYMVSTNPDGSETVHQCTPGQPGAPGLHGLDGLIDDITAPIAATLGPNWLLYLGLGAAAWFFMKKRR